jgi:hypothetical protein
MSEEVAKDTVKKEGADHVMSDIEKEALIVLVQAEPWLWDTSTHEYSKRDLKDNCWTKVARELSAQFQRELSAENKDAFTG